MLNNRTSHLCFDIPAENNSQQLCAKVENNNNNIVMHAVQFSGKNVMFMVGHGWSVHTCKQEFCRCNCIVHNCTCVKMLILF